MDGTILIADDDRSIRTVLTQALSRAGCRVHATGSLQQLLKWVEEGRGDLVVTDVMMPDGNGIDTIPAIRRVRPDLPVDSAPAFLDYARAHPGKLSYGSPGNGTTPHIAGELLKQNGRITATHVPYRGAAPAATESAGLLS